MPERTPWTRCPRCGHRYNADLHDACPKDHSISNKQPSRDREIRRPGRDRRLDSDEENR